MARHSAIVRIAHWCQALAIVIMIMIGSGWRIYDNLPIMPFMFPYWMTLGGDRYVATTTSNDWGTANAIAWHFAAMWLLLFGFGLFVANGILTGHFRRAFLRDFVDSAGGPARDVALERPCPSSPVQRPAVGARIPQDAVARTFRYNAYHPAQDVVPIDAGRFQEP